MQAHQLTLACLRRKPAKPLARAKRDFTAAEFERALLRNRIARDGDLHFIDQSRVAPMSMGLRVRFEAVCRTDPIRIDRRATLARILRARLQERTAR